MLLVSRARVGGVVLTDCCVGAVSDLLVARAALAGCASRLGWGCWALLLGRGELGFDQRLQVGQVRRHRGDKVRKDGLVRGWQPTRQKGVRAWEVWRQGRRKGVGSDELRASALVLEEKAQVSGGVLVAALESIEVSVDALSVGACPVPHVVAHVYRSLATESVVLLRCNGLEEGIILWQVERR